MMKNEIGYYIQWEILAYVASQPCIAMIFSKAGSHPNVILVFLEKIYYIPYNLSKESLILMLAEYPLLTQVVSQNP